MWPAKAFTALTILLPQTKSPIQKDIQVVQLGNLTLPYFSLIYMYVMICDLPLQNYVLILTWNGVSQFGQWTVNQDYFSCLHLLYSPVIVLYKKSYTFHTVLYKCAQIDL